MSNIIVNKHNCVFGLAGFSNSGKTTLTVSLIKIFSQKGFSVGSIKHAHHSFQIDQPGKDSWKHRKAGSQEVIVSSTKRIAHIIERQNGKEANLKELLSLSSKKDILIVEGFKKEQFPKLEVWREKENNEILSFKDKDIFAIATDNPKNKNLENINKINILNLNDPKKIVEFLIYKFKLKKTKALNRKTTNEINFDQARKIILSKIKPLIKKETVPLQDCNSRVLLNDVYSKINLPNKNNAAVDGFGFNYKDYDPENGSNLKISKVIKAGLQQVFSVKEDTAVKIFTGSILPRPINTIAMQEECKEKNGCVFIPPKIKEGINFRPAGENIRKHQLVIKSGHLLNTTEIGLASSLGMKNLVVNKKLKIVIVSTGNEIIQAGEKLNSGLVYDSNGPMIFNSCLETGNEPYLNEIIKDNPEKLKFFLKKLIKNYDLIIFSGGASEGEEDHIKSVINDMKGRIHFWRLSIKPGRPMGFASINDVPIFCLPGNPVAAQICFRLLVETGIKKRMAALNSEIIKMPAIAQFNQKCKIGRKEFLRGKLFYKNNTYYVKINGKPGAGVLTSLSGANGLIEVGENIDNVMVGDIVNFIPFKEALL
mgnify:FL=1